MNFFLFCVSFLIDVNIADTVERETFFYCVIDLAKYLKCNI